MRRWPHSGNAKLNVCALLFEEISDIIPIVLER